MDKLDSRLQTAAIKKGYLTLEDTINIVKNWLVENRECPQEPLTEKQIQFYYRTYDNLIFHQLQTNANQQTRGKE
jgi:hypothetical protein